MMNLKWTVAPNLNIGSYKLYRDSTLLSTVAVPTGNSLQYSEDNGEILVSYADAGGSLTSQYKLETYDSNGQLINGSMTSVVATPSGAPLCLVQGAIIDLQGNPIVDAKISVKLKSAPSNVGAASVSQNATIEYLSNLDGTFYFTILQGLFCQLTIDEIGYSLPIQIPNQHFVQLSELQVNTDYRYPTTYVEG